MIPELLWEGFLSPGFLAIETCGRDECSDNLDQVHAALGDYQCSIREKVVEGSLAC